MTKILCLLWMLLLLISISEGNELNELYVIGGMKAFPGQFPYVGYISTPNKANPQFSITCTVTIIDSKWVLTAAHCYKENSNFKLHVGSVDQWGPSYATYDIEKFVLYERYQFNNFGHQKDLALAKVRGNIVFNDRVKKINLATGVTPTGTKALALGFGDESPPGQEPRQSGHLEFIYAKVFSNADCTKYVWHISPNEICGSTAPRTGICWGDSGGPLIVNNKVIGVLTQFGTLGTCASTLPDLYTEVYKYLDWIKTHMKD